MRDVTPSRLLTCRLVVLPGKDKGGTWLCTNLGRSTYPPPLVAKLYGFRWQIELLFKEWKSYANLREFDTANPNIAEGLIWARFAA
jgi:IS4 transposase